MIRADDNHATFVVSKKKRFFSDLINIQETVRLPGNVELSNMLHGCSLSTPAPLNSGLATILFR